MSETITIPEEGDVIKGGPWDGFQVISVYSRKQAIEDGYLVDVSHVAKEAGIKFPVALTRTVWDGYVEPSEESKKYGQSVNGRLWDTVWMLRHAIRSNGPSSTIHYSLIYIMKANQRRRITLKALCHPGDDGAPVITIMLPEEN